MQQNEDQTPYHGELNEAGQPSMRSILAEMDANNGLGAQVQLSGVDRHLVVEAAKNGLDVNTGEPLQPGQTPSPLEGTHPATHQEQADIAQPYQTEREEMARDEGQGQQIGTPNQLSQQNWIEKSVQNQINAGNAIANGVNSLKQSYNDYWNNPKVPGTDTSPAPSADALWSDIRSRMSQNSDPTTPIVISADEFQTILDDETARTHALQLEQADAVNVPSVLASGLSDSEFFELPNQMQRFVIEGHPNENGAGVPAVDANYIRVGMNMAASGLPRESVAATVTAYNGLNIAQGQGVDHNTRQMSSGTYWARVGYDAYLQRYGKQE